MPTTAGTGSEVTRIATIGGVSELTPTTGRLFPLRFRGKGLLRGRTEGGECIQRGGRAEQLVVLDVEARDAAEAGADDLINYAEEDLKDALKQRYPKGVDVIYDPVGGEVLEKSVRAAAYGARLLVVGFTSGGPSKLMSNHILIKGLSVLGVRAGETPLRLSPELGRDYVEELPRLAALGVMRPHVSHRFPMEQAAAAFRVLMDRKVVGKVAIEMTSAS